MSYLTDKLRDDDAATRCETQVTHVPGQMMDDVLNSMPLKRRAMLRGSLGASLTALFGAGSLAACGGGGEAKDEVTPPPLTPTKEDYSIGFAAVDATVGKTVTVPSNYQADVLYSAGDALMSTAIAYKGTAMSLSELEQIAGGQHDGMHLFPITGRDANKNALLAINHENTDDFMLHLGERSSADAVTARLSNVGVSVVEIKLNDTTDKWEVVVGSVFNKRYTGNTLYTIDGPAQGAVGEIDGQVQGTLNNCASGTTPWGTYLTCEETTSNYFNTSKDAKGYGWVVEIDPQGELSQFTTPVKHTAMGRFAHENTAYLLHASNRLAFYMGDDSTPGAIYKFVPSGTYNPSQRASNATLLSTGTLYAAKFSAGGTGEWLALTHGLNGLGVGAIDPGRTDRTPGTPTTIDFNDQADVVINCQAAARVAGATLMDRPEWITVGKDGTVYCTLTKNGGRTVSNDANPRTANAHGHIIEWQEAGNDPTATTFTWNITVLAGSKKETATNSKGNIVGNEFSSPDGLDVDHQDRLWVQTDADTGASITNIFGNNAMYHLNPETRQSRRFLVGPDGCEITGLTYTPDLKTFFINVQHPGTGWPLEGTPGRSSTVVVRHNERKPVGAA